jgi:hypothetical protein
VDERRKIALLLAASILAARRIATAPKNSPAYVSAIADAIQDAEQILSRIDARYPKSP